MPKPSRPGPCCLIALLLLAAPALAADTKLPGLSAPVEIYTDGHGIPHIYAKSWTDAARALGYLHARDRLWQMDMFRRQASGQLAEIIGRDSLESDMQMRRLGIRRSCETLWQSDRVPVALRAELEAYAAGVNARLSTLKDHELPVYCQSMGNRPKPWSPIDSLAFSKYMGWDQSGTSDDLWLGMLHEKLGSAAIDELFPLDRPYEIPTVKFQAQANKLAAVHPAPAVDAAASYAAALDRLPAPYLTLRGLSFGSNNWAVDGTKTATGKPLLCSDPHLGFRLPAIWYTAHLSVGSENVAGVTFPSGPVVIIGHNDRIAWGITNMQADAVDYYIETVDPTDPLKYQHRGQWKHMERVTEEIQVRGEAAVKFDIDSTVHGPVINREGKTISLCWTGLGPTEDLAALWGVSRARNVSEYLTALKSLTVPAINVIYSDIDGNIAIHPCGALPLRNAGQGRVPMDGASGDHDWAGMIPRDQLPLSVNPPDHFVASANSRPAGVGYPHYLGWMWDASYRVRRINHLLTEANDLTLDKMKLIQCDAYDEAAACFLPSMLSAIDPASLDDPVGRQAFNQVKMWDYVSDVDALGAIVWMRWFSLYRSSVWDDEWQARGVEQRGGGWGFSGNNRREPILEVLEYITREFPRSAWFDDRTTPERETRDDLSRRTFAKTIESLKQELGVDPKTWTWGRVNQLRILSMSGQEELARHGIPIVGTVFTLNPGGDIGPVGGGASWRMIVDFADMSRSIGAYPGGQNEHPASPQYDDQIKIWAANEYLPLNMAPKPGSLPAEIRQAKHVFIP